MNHLELLTVYNETLFESETIRNNVVVKMGDFEKKVLVIVNKSEWIQGNEEFLKKILSSCNLNDNDYLIAVMAEGGNIFDIIRQFTPEVLFLFGLNLESDFFKSNKSVYKPFIFNNIRIALADTLEVVKADKEKRLLLWNQCIKPIFNIK